MSVDSKGTSAQVIPPPLIMGWILSDSIGRQLSLVVASGCLFGLIGILKGEGLNLDAALGLSGLIVAAIVLDVVRAYSKHDPVYGLPLAWKGAFVVLAIMVAGIFAMMFLVLQKSDLVSELWSLLSKAGMTELLVSTMFRRTDPRG